MFLHVGNGKYIRRESVIGIFDFDTATVAVKTRRFLQRKQEEGKIDLADSDIPKSFILADGKKEKSFPFSPCAVKNRRALKKESRIVFSKVSSVILAARTESFEKDITEN